MAASLRLLVISSVFGYVAGLSIDLEDLDTVSPEASPRRPRVLYGITSRSPNKDKVGALQLDDPVLYGIYSSNVSKYQPMLTAQFDTWAKNLPRSDIIVSGSEKDDQLEGVDSVPLKCSDDPDGQPCKEGTLLYRAVQRARKENADWLVSITEDKYVWTSRLEKQLAELDPSVPLVYASVGCGWGNADFCEEVYLQGGICGGNGYVVSRAALEQLVSSPDQSYDDFMEEYLEIGNGAPSDINTACFLFKRGIQIAGTFVSDVSDPIYDEISTGSDEDVITSAKSRMRSDTSLTHLVMGGNDTQVPLLMHGFYDAMLKEEGKQDDAV